MGPEAPSRRQATVGHNRPFAQGPEFGLKLTPNFLFVNAPNFAADMTSLVETLKKSTLDNPMGQGIYLPAKNFSPKYGDLFKVVFNGADKPMVTRSTVFQAFAHDHRTGYLMTLAWGFPRGTRPGGQSLKPAIDAMPLLLPTLGKLRTSPLTEETYADLHRIPHVKNAVVTKLLYFAGAASAEGHAALIYDSCVHTYLLKVNPVEYRSLTRELRTYVAVPTPEQYLKYIRLTAQVAHDAGLSDPAAVEMFMFANAPGKRRPRHLFVVQSGAVPEGAPPATS